MRARSERRRCRVGRVDRARLRTRICSRVRQPGGDRHGGALAQRAADTRGLPDHLERQQRADSRARRRRRSTRSHAARAGRARAAPATERRREPFGSSPTPSAQACAHFSVSARRVQLVRRAGAGRAEEQSSGRREGEVAAVGSVRAVLGLIPVDSPPSRQQRLLREAAPEQDVRRAGFERPVLHLAVGFFTSMWSQTWGLVHSILRDRALERDRLVRVELGREGVVRPQRHRCGGQDNARPATTTTSFVLIGSASCLA